MITKPSPQHSPGPIDRLARALGGIERVSETGLPVEEFVHPWPLLALALLGVNDHLLKGSGLVPGWLTGKLSDLAGLFFFPLFLTSAVGTLGLVVHRATRGRWPDYSLSSGKLLVAIGVTAVLFVPLKLSVAWGTLYIEALRTTDVLGWFGHFQVTKDPTDLVAIVMFPLAFLHGRRFVRRVPLGRLRVLEGRCRPLAGAARQAAVTAGLADVRRLAGPAAQALDRFASAYAAVLAGGAPARARDLAEQALEGYRAALGEPG